MKVAESSKEFVLAPEGTHLARLVEIIDFGSQHNEKYNQTARKIHVTFELVDEMYEFDAKVGPQPFRVSRLYTLSLNEKASLRKDLEAWRGKKFKDKDFEDGGFELTDLLGSKGTVQVVHNEVGERTYANIQSLGTPVKGTKVKKPSTEPLIFDLDEFDEDIFDALPEWMRDKIKDSPEYEMRGVTVAEGDILDNNE